MINRLNSSPLTPLPMLCDDSPLRVESILTMASSERRLLCIGNSLTFEHRVPRLVSLLAAAATPAQRLGTRMITRGGADLGWHRQQGHAAQAIAEGIWHWVLIQDQSRRPALSPAESVADCCYFAELARAAGAQPLFYATWATADDPELLTPLRTSYAEAARQSGCAHAPVGDAFALARQRLPHIPLHREDHLHPTPAGSLLAAAVIASYCGIVPPQRMAMPMLDAEAALVNIPEGQAGDLLRIARELCQASQ
ncbi:MAG: SGNH/GDSL hydrolase family protein [Planctomycetota bacterium]|nr:MAG: SGNH/GDSL hydrolase family protein [Planctomycetota bacterium]